MRTRQTGQAAVESVGITVLVALLLAAASAWLVQSVRPGAPPVDPVDEVGRPLAEAGDAIARAAPGLPQLLGARGGAAPITRALRAVGRGVITGFHLTVDIDRAFRTGAQDRLDARAREVWRDPLGAVVALPDPDDLTPGGVAALVLERSGAIVDYVDRVRRLPPRRVATTLAHDAGALTVDVGLALLQRRVGRLLTGAGRRGPAPAPPTPPSAPGP